MSEQEWAYGGTRFFHPDHWSKAGFTLHAVFVPCPDKPEFVHGWEAVYTTTEEQARTLISAVNALARLGIAPEEAGEQVRALVLAARRVEVILSHIPARSATEELRTALAPFVGLKEE